MPKQKSNIMVVVMDTVAAKHMSLYGYNRLTTPNLERIAAESTLYTRCFSPADWTPPAHASLFTGLYPSGHGISGQFRFLDTNFPHLISILKQLGYRTYGVSSNAIVSPRTGILRDLDQFYDYSGLMDFGFLETKPLKPNLFDKILSQRNWDAQTRWGRLLTLLKYVLESNDLGYIPRRLLAKYLMEKALVIKYSATKTKKSFLKGLSLVKENGFKLPTPPLFIFINVMEAHALYNPPGNFRRFSQPSDKNAFPPVMLYDSRYDSERENTVAMFKNLYDDELLFLDNEIGRFYDELKAAKALDNTILIITSDHGEHFGEKGHYAHRFTLYQELTKVPLIIRYPQYIKGPGVDDRLVSLTDIFATLLDVTNCPFPCPRDSRSLLSSEKRDNLSAMILKDGPAQQHLAKMVSHPPEWAEAKLSHAYSLVLDNNLKIIETHHGEIEIYHLGRDPDENHDLSVTLDPSLVQELKNFLVKDKLQTQYIT